MNLSGKTIFVTGASRGIGKAISLRAARDGANIAVLGKTKTPHPQLPGTVDETVLELESVGGKALGCIADVRNEDQVEEAVRATVTRFGGIDVVVNNASAIFLSATPQTPLKRFDLMQAVNARGTFVTSQACLPYLLKSGNPHILNIAPPLNLDPKWFAPHLAYSMAKFGMSLCVLGMAEEFRSEGIAVNALWPKTAIATAAIRNVLGGEEALQHCRKPIIMADAAHWILTQNSRTITGNFFVDEEVLAATGTIDFEPYAMSSGCDLIPDFFV